MTLLMWWVAVSVLSAAQQKYGVRIELFNFESMSNLHQRHELFKFASVFLEIKFKRYTVLCTK